MIGQISFLQLSTDLVQDFTLQFNTTKTPHKLIPPCLVSPQGFITMKIDGCSSKSHEHTTLQVILLVKFFVVFERRDIKQSEFCRLSQTVPQRKVHCLPQKLVNA